jgi:hypothetical protein
MELEDLQKLRHIRSGADHSTFAEPYSRENFFVPIK